MQAISLQVDHSMSAEAMTALATHLEDIARLYRLRAAELNEWQRLRDNAAESNRTIQSRCATAIERQLARGLDLDDAINAAAAAETDIPPDCLRHHWKKHLKAQTAAAKAKRGQTILALARQGHSNAEIGQKVNLHPASVSRIIRNQIASRGNKPAGP